MQSSRGQVAPTFLFLRQTFQYSLSMAAKRSSLAPTARRSREPSGFLMDNVVIYVDGQYPLSKRAAMKDRVKLMGAGIALFVLTMGGILTLFQLLFDAWMTAYPFANMSEWRIRFFIRLVTIVVIGGAWSAIAAWLFRHMRCVEGLRSHE